MGRVKVGDVRPPSLVLPVALISILFYSAMYMSKVVQPLYFDDMRALRNFGLGYTAMAIAGTSSFAWGFLADRTGGRRLLSLGLGIYAVGLAGRIFTQPFPVIASSSIAGIGASMVLVSFRAWIRPHVAVTGVAPIVGARNLGMQTGIVAGTLCASLILEVAPSRNGERGALLTASFLTFFSAVYLWYRDEPVNARQVILGTPNRSQGHRSFSILLLLSALGVLYGGSSSLIIPYLPLLIRDAGATNSESSAVVGLLSIAQILVAIVYSKGGRWSSGSVFGLTAGIMAGMLTLVLAGVSGLLWLSAGLILRAGIFTGFSLYQEAVQYQVIPQASMGRAFGLYQSLFLVGDALGGYFGASWLSRFGASFLFEVSGAATLASVIVLWTISHALRTLPRSPLHL